MKNPLVMCMGEHLFDVGKVVMRTIDPLIYSWVLERKTCTMNL